MELSNRTPLACIQCITVFNYYRLRVSANYVQCSGVFLSGKVLNYGLAPHGMRCFLQARHRVTLDAGSIASQAW
jgi:hypothetical protein